MNYITKTAQANPFADITLEAGSYEFYRGQVDINQPLIADTLLFRFNSEAQNLFQWVHPSQSKDYQIAPTMTWKTCKNSAADRELRGVLPQGEPAGLQEDRRARPEHVPGPRRQRHLPEPASAIRSISSAPTTGGARTRRCSTPMRRSASASTGRCEASYQWQRSTVDELYTGVSNLVGNPDGTVPLEKRRVRYQLDSNQNYNYTINLAGNYDFGWMKWKPVFGAYWDGSRQYEVQRTADPEPVPRRPGISTIPRPGTTTPPSPPTELPLGYEFGIDSSDAAYYTAETFEFLQDRLIAVGGLRYSIARSVTVDNPDFGPFGYEQGFVTSITTPQVGVGFKILAGRPPLRLLQRVVPAAGLRPLHERCAERPRQADRRQGNRGRASRPTSWAAASRRPSRSSTSRRRTSCRRLNGAFDPVTGVSTTTTVQIGEAESHGATAEITYSPDEQLPDLRVGHVRQRVT